MEQAKIHSIVIRDVKYNNSNTFGTKPMVSFGIDLNSMTVCMMCLFSSTHI